MRSAENSGYNNLEQRIPKSRFISGVYTLSFLVSNPGETKQVYIFGVDTVWDPQGALCSITAYVDCNALPDIVTIGLQKSISATPLTVIAAKLELGSQQTLAHRDASGNWVLNDPPPNKALELLKCQRYFCKFSGTAAGIRYQDQPAVVCYVPTPAAMRIDPAIIQDANTTSLVYMDNDMDTVTSATVLQRGPAGIQLRIPTTKAAGNHIANVHLEISLSADL